MHDTGKQVLSLMFRSEETVCVSHNQFGYHSIPLNNALNGPVVLVPTEDSVVKRNIKFEDAIETIDSDVPILCALNPIKGYRNDLNCTAYRNFLIEMDYGAINDQLAYVKQLKMPYSAAIFSGNKSIHFLISLDTDLPSENVYRTFSEWILNIATLADQNTKNPSRSIRIPGAFREPGKQQTLLEYRGVVTIAELSDWLKKHPNAKPKEKQQVGMVHKTILERVRPKISDLLVNRGIHSPNRNKQWFMVGVEFALAGVNEDDTIEGLRGFFQSDRDFKEKEWETTIHSAYKWARERKK
jgi:hypothetical protein